MGEVGAREEVVAVGCYGIKTWDATERITRERTSSKVALQAKSHMMIT